MNKGLKEIGKHLGIDEPVSIIKFVGSKRIEKIVPKWQVMTTHVARKSFISIAMAMGMKTEIIMSISGHKTHSSFKRYYKLVDDYKLAEMKKYFNK
jgi:integrase